MARTLRPKQEAAIRMLRQSLSSGHRRPMLQSPTGSGKTVIAGSIINGAQAKGKRVIFCVPTIDLVDQTLTSFFNDGIYDVGVIQADHPSTNFASPVQIACTPSLARRNLPKADLVIIDEAHRHFDFYERWMNMDEWKNVPFIGMSATPWRKGLGKFYDDLIIGATIQELIDDKLLSEFRVFAPPAESKPDLDEIKVVAGDYHEGELSKEMQKPKLVADVVTTWLAKGQNLPTLCFAVDRAHANKLRSEFEKAGVSTGYIDSYTERNERNALRQQFQEGRVKVICNVGCMTTGTDLDVRCLILARPTRSEALYVQIIGRALRIAEGKEYATILDHSDTTARLGFVTDIHYDELDDGSSKRSKSKKKERDPNREPLPRECLACGCLRPEGVRKCPSCGFESMRPSKIVHADGELREVTPSKVKYTKQQKQEWYSMFLHTYKFIHHEKGSRNQISHWYRKKFGVWPRDMKEYPMEPTAEVVNFVSACKRDYVNSIKNKGTERHDEIRPV